MPIRWGILGTGKIAGKFAQALPLVPDAELVAVGSRSVETARRFAAANGVSRAYGSYEELARDPEVDVVYVATPHVLHAENTLLCLEAGKPVLCEKPFTLNAAEARQVIAFARERGLYVMEAMWMRFIPLVRRFRELIEEGAIGEPLLLHADFGFRADFPPEHRLYDPRLGGGALLDLGVYPIHLAYMVWGKPDTVSGVAHLGPTGVDEQGGMVLGYAGGHMAVLSTSTRVDTPVEATLMGAAGRMRLHRRFHHATRLTITTEAGEQSIEMPFTGNGLQYEALEVMRCLKEGRTESDIMPLDETLSIMETLDALRSMWGLRYPGESI